MFASLRYIQTHHDFAQIPGQPDLNPYSEANKKEKAPAADNEGAKDGAADGVAQPSTAIDQVPEPDSPEVFQASLRELARDLILKEQQIEYLISVLPGIGNSEQDQNSRIQALSTSLREIEDERKTAAQSKEEMLRMLGDLAANCKRVY